jgi:hypothetical protein
LETRPQVKNLPHKGKGLVVWWILADEFVWEG